MAAQQRQAAVAVGLAVIFSMPMAAQGSGGRRPTAPRPPAWALHGTYTPAIDPTNFVSRVENPYFPLQPGVSFHYAGVKDGAAQTDDVVVTHQVKNVLGVSCTVVRDTVSEHGKPLERTFDWYAQDKQGDVWYMGEDALELQNGRFVRASDSWEAGVKSAKPGIIMRGHPRGGQVHRQEYYPPGGALDQARVVATSAAASVPAGSFRRVLVTDEWSPVEPQMERKYYVAGIGEIKEQVTAGGHEQFQLVRTSKNR